MCIDLDTMASMIRTLLLICCVGLTARAADWTTFGHDAQRSGWAMEETTINRDNAATMVLKWKTKVPNESYSLSALTAPVVASVVSTAKGVRTVAKAICPTASVAPPARTPTTSAPITPAPP